MVLSYDNTILLQIYLYCISAQLHALDTLEIFQRR